MICNHLLKLPPQVLTNRPCCVLSYAPNLYWQRNNNLINANSGGDQTSQPRYCVSAYISVVILTPILKPSMKASFSDRAISDSWEFSICSSFSFCCSVVSIELSSSSNFVISDSFFLVSLLCLYSLGLIFPK